MSPLTAAAGSHGQLWQLMVGLLGFLTYKLALVTVAIAPQDPAASMVAALRKAKLSGSLVETERDRK